MKQYRVSAAARRDLDDIWFYIAQDNVEAADRFITTLVGRFPKLGALPDLDDHAKNWEREFAACHWGTTSFSIGKSKTESK